MAPLCLFLVLLTKISQVPCAEVTNTSTVVQDSGLVRARAGQSVTLRCTCHGNVISYFYWYQQSMGDNPRLILQRMRRHAQAEVSPEFRGRFRTSAGDATSNHLTIADLGPSDSALYLCGILEFNTIQFGQGVFLHVAAPPSDVRASVDQPAAQLLRPGDALSLSCVANTDCAEEPPRLFWVKREASKAVSVYPDASRCAGRICTANLTRQPAGPSDAGMYHCVLASCGQIVFGSGTTVVMAGASTSPPPLLVCCLSVALAISTTALLVLAFTACRQKRKLHILCSGAEPRPEYSEATSEDADGLHYAALSLKRSSQPHRPGDSVESECVYSRVKNHRE